MVIKNLSLLSPARPLVLYVVRRWSLIGVVIQVRGVVVGGMFLWAPRTSMRGVKVSSPAHTSCRFLKGGGGVGLVRHVTPGPHDGGCGGWRVRVALTQVGISLPVSRHRR